MKKQTNPSIKAQILRSTFILLALVAVTAIPFALAHPRSPGTAKRSVAASAMQADRTLTFADRVAYQRAMEEVYWQHRIWPKANAGPKPPLAKVMSEAQIEEKVEDYLRNSQALEDYWQKPITPDQLQAEMERMASHTKQPGVLRELFAVLGNDPFVIAECLARPILAERLLTELYAHDQRFHGELKRRAEAELRTHRSLKDMKQTSGMHTEAEWIKSDSAETGSASADTKNIEAVKMNGSEWQERIEKLAGEFGSAKEGDALGQIKTGVLSPLQEDEGHYYAVAVMKKGKDRLKLATVAWLKEPLRSWLAKAETQVPVTMAAVSASYTLPVIASPSAGCTDDTWMGTRFTNIPAGRDSHTAVWTGSEMIVWGGYDGNAWLNTGGRYNPITNSWTVTSTNNAPTGRWLHTAVWTGSQMIVWGGAAEGPVYLNTGGRYNPTTDSWTPTSTTGVPVRYSHTAVWTGSEMIVWGGLAGSPNYLSTGKRCCAQFAASTPTSTRPTTATASPTPSPTPSSSGGRYNPITDTWTATSTTNAPDGRAYHTAVWTGSEMIVWGGLGVGLVYLNTGARYNPSTDRWTPTNVPTASADHTAVWTGSEMIVWGGTGNGFVNARYDPSTDSWTATSTTNAPDARTGHTAVWTGSQMIVWGGYNSSSFYLNSGGKYNPSTDSWTATSLFNAPTARQLHTAVWTGSQMIVWGGITPPSTPTPPPHPSPSPTPSPTPTGTPIPTPTPPGTGGIYDPITDSWTATSTIVAPAGRQFHTAVWSGSQMIVWGGW